MKIVLKACIHLGELIGDHSMTTLLLCMSLYSQLFTLTTTSVVSYKREISCVTIVQCLSICMNVINEMKDIIAPVLMQLHSIDSNSNSDTMEYYCKSIWKHIIRSSINEDITKSLCDILVRINL